MRLNSLVYSRFGQVFHIIVRKVGDGSAGNKLNMDMLSWQEYRGLARRPSRVRVRDGRNVYSGTVTSTWRSGNRVPRRELGQIR